MYCLFNTSFQIPIHFLSRQMSTPLEVLMNIINGLCLRGFKKFKRRFYQSYCKTKNICSVFIFTIRILRNRVLEVCTFSQNIQFPTRTLQNIFFLEINSYNMNSRNGSRKICYAVTVLRVCYCMFNYTHSSTLIGTTILMKN